MVATTNQETREMSLEYAAVFMQLLEQVASDQTLREMELTAFWPQRGPLYQGELAIVGRSVNKWYPQCSFLGREASTPGGRLNIASQTRTVSETDGFPVRRQPREEDENENWEFNNAYKRARLLKIANALVGFPSLFWTELFKIAPAGGGNPSLNLRRLQLSSCTDLIRLELHELRPQRVLAMTGLANWLDWFAEGLGIKLQHYDGQYVEALGLTEGESWVVAKHPMTAKEDLYALEVKQAFSELGKPLPNSEGKCVTEF